MKFSDHPGMLHWAAQESCRLVEELKNGEADNVNTMDHVHCRRTVSDLLPMMMPVVQKAEARNARVWLFAQGIRCQVPNSQTLNVIDIDRLRVQRAHSVMDVGGGSGIVSLALLRRCKQLTAVVVDIAKVYVAGREIAEENSIEGRITYCEADFLGDELPSVFDMTLQCNVKQTIVDRQ